MRCLQGTSSKCKYEKEPRRIGEVGMVGKRKKKLALFREGAAVLPQSPVAMGAGRVCGGFAIFRYFYKEGKNPIF